MNDNIFKMALLFVTCAALYIEHRHNVAMETIANKPIKKWWKK